MIQWLAPWAFAGAALLAAPLLVHMLLRRHARRVVFPATHFVPPTRPASVRFRRPSDVGLLVLRLAIVAAAILAVAQPIFITSARIAGWNARTVRAVIVDTSRGMPNVDETVRREQQAAFHSSRFAGRDLRDSIARAAAWLAVAPPGRREAVIVSDFRKGAIDKEDLQLLPADVGVRTIRAGTPPVVRDLQLPVVGGVRGGTWQPSLRVEPGVTHVTWSRIGDEPALSWLRTAEAPIDREAAIRAVRAAVASGIAEGDAAQQVTVRFAGAPADQSERRRPRARWMVDAALALRRSALAAETNAKLSAFEQDGRFVVETTASADSIEAAAIVRAVVLAVRPGSIADRDAEVVTASDAELGTWSRESAPIAGTPGRPMSGVISDSDARWLWLLALLLLGVETWLRRARADSTVAEVRNAA